MRTFAKIIELPDTQVLLIVDGADDENVEAVLRIMMDMGDVVLTFSLGFKTRDAAQETFDGYNKEMAEVLYAAHKGIVDETFNKEEEV